LNLDEKVMAFCVASVRGWTHEAATMLAETPAIAGHSFATALLLGDAERVRAEIDRDPGAATRADPATGWTPLHMVCASRWYRLDPGRTAGLAEAARLLLDAGADPNAAIGGTGRSPFACAAAAASSGTGNEAVIALLLDRGATVTVDDLYMTAFSEDGYRCLGLLLGHAAATAPDMLHAAGQVLAAPVSAGSVDGVRLLLDAGVDPRRYADDDGEPTSAVYAAVHAGCPAELIALLTEHGADPREPGPDGHTPAWLATVRGRTDLAALLGTDDAAGVCDTARFAGTCVCGDWEAATRLVASDPSLIERMDSGERAALVQAAEAGDESAVALMLELGFPLTARRDDGATALHAAAYAGDAWMVRLLLDRGADIEALDGQWHSPPLDWAVVGSGQRPATSPRPDWGATVRLLLGAGASTADITLTPGDPKAPSAEVADLLRAHGVGRPGEDGADSR
jgi:ankyrin repeat protein